MVTQVLPSRTAGLAGSVLGGPNPSSASQSTGNVAAKYLIVPESSPKSSFPALLAQGMGSRKAPATAAGAHSRCDLIRTDLCLGLGQQDSVERIHRQKIR